MIGETIKDFTITAQLGRGGMGEVFVAEQKIVKTKVAIKMLLAEVSNESHVQRFFNEAIAVGQIKHAGIVKIFDVGFHAGRAYLIMEFLDGEPLSRRLRKELPFAAAIDVALQITSILDATHAAGITHRDLKPDNVFLVPDAEVGERVRILDFGIAKLGVTKMTAAAMSMGTPAYMAPELWMDAATSGPHTDIYAFGCLLFELCCTRPPFPVIAISEACGKHLGEIPPRLRDIRPDVPQALDDLVAKMLEKAPADRPTTKQVAATLASLSTAGVGPATPRFSKEQPAVDSTAIGHIAAPVSLSSDDAALASKYETEGRWMDLVKLLTRHAESVSTLDKPTVYLQIAGIYHDRFANQAEAIKAYEHVLEHESGNRRAIEQLRSLYEKRRDWEKLIELEKAELDLTSPEKRADKAVEVARLAAARVGKADVTIYWWERVLEFEPDHRQALAELAKSYEHAERWYDLVSVLERQAEAAQGNDDRVAALRRLASVHEERLGDPGTAKERWNQVLELAPGDAEAKRTLERIAAGKPPPKATVPAASPENPTVPAKPAALPQFKYAALAKEEATTKPAVDDATKATEAVRTSKSAVPKILVGIGVLAIAGGVVYFVTRSPKRDTPAAIADARAPSIDAGVAAIDAAATTLDAATATADGLVLSYRVLSKPPGPGEFHIVAPGETLHTDDRMIFEVMVSEPAHVFISQRTKGKTVSVLFPNSGIDVTNPLPPKTWIRIPAATASFRLDDKDLGAETAYFVASRVPPTNLANAIAGLGKPDAKPHAIEDQLVVVAMEKRNDCTDKTRKIVLDDDGPCKAGTRGLVLDDATPRRPSRRVQAVDEVIFVPFTFEHAPKAGASAFPR